MQTSIASLEPAFPGLISDASRKMVRTAANEEASAEMPYGTMVKMGVGATGALKLSAIYVALVVADTVFTAEADDDLATAVAHGLQTGDGPVRVSNAGGGLPTGLLAATDYWIIRITANTFKFASSLANALNGVGIDLTTDGTGVQTLSDTASTERQTPYKMLGVICHGHSYALPDEVGETGLKPKATLGLMYRGTIWVLTEGAAPTKADPVHVRAEAAGMEVAGAFRASADGTDTYDISEIASWTGRVGTNMAELELDMANVDVVDVD